MPGAFIPSDHEPQPGEITLEDFAAADFAVEQALRFGSFDALVDRLRQAVTLLPAERDLAAAIIAGEFKRPPHRAAGDPEALRFNELYLALCVCVQTNTLGRKRAVAAVAKEHRVSESKVQKAASKHPELFTGRSK